jgi:two-component system sensor histidine kinase ChvG
VAAASRRLVEKLTTLDTSKPPERDLSNRPPSLLGAPAVRETRSEGEYSRGWQLLPPLPISDLAAELAANRDLVAAMAGPSISISLNIENSALPVSLTGEELTRVLVNLVKNAAEAMPEGGVITFALHEFHAGTDAASWLVLTIEDNGPGISPSILNNVFDAGFTTRPKSAYEIGSWLGTHHGLGLSISHSILEAAGGSIHATNREQGGARFVIELPVRNR